MGGGGGDERGWIDRTLYSAAGTMGKVDNYGVLGVGALEARKRPITLDRRCVQAAQPPTNAPRLLYHRPNTAVASFGCKVG